MLYISKIKLPDNSEYGIKTINSLTIDGKEYTGEISQIGGDTIKYVTGTGTAAVTSSPYNYAKWEASIPSITELYDGLTIAYKVPVAGNASRGTCLQINSLGYHPVVTGVNSMIGTRYAVNATILLIYQSAVNGTVYDNSASSSTIAGCWVAVNDYDSSNTVPSAYCSTSAATAAKTATCTSYALLAKSYLHVTIATANTAKKALTLNVNSKGAKPIYINGAATSTSNYTLPAGTYLVFYDGTNYYFRTDGKLTADITGDATTVNGLNVQTEVPKNAIFTDTTYTFSGGTNSLTITPKGGTAQTVQVGPVVSANSASAGNTEIGSITIDGTTTTFYAPTAATTISVIQAATSPSIMFIVGTHTSTTAALTGLSSADALVEGMIIYYFTPYAWPNQNVTLKLTYPNGTDTGEIPVYSAANNRMVPKFPSGTVIPMVYYNNGFYLANGPFGYVG